MKYNTNKFFDYFQILGSLVPPGILTKKSNENDTKKSLNAENSLTPITKISA